MGAREVLGKSGYRQQVAIAAFTDIINRRQEKAPATFGREANQRGSAGGLSPKRLVHSSFTLVDPSSQLECRI